MVKQRGRKAKHYIAASGDQIKGLAYHKKSERWRIIDGNRFFRAANEAEAIRKFRQLTSGKPSTSDLWAKSQMFSPKGQDTIVGRVLSAEDPEEQFWIVMAEEIAAHPKLCAEKTGIEWLAWHEHKMPKPLPSPKEIENTWFNNAECKSNERRKVRDAWKDFVEVTKIANPKDITDELCIKFKDDVMTRGWAHRTCLRHFNRVRRIISFQIERGICRAEFTNILALLKLLKLKRTKRIVKPNPIKKETFFKLLDGADPVDKLMLLMMANYALYLEEASRVWFEDIDADGVFTDQREKAGQVFRCAVSWPETLEALEAVRKLRRAGVKPLFVGQHGGQITVSGAGKRFRKLRKAVGLGEETTPAQIRDRAEQAMMEDATINTNHRKIVMGHSNGIDDNYAVRVPKMVAPACETIRRFYFGS